MVNIWHLHALCNTYLILVVEDVIIPPMLICPQQYLIAQWQVIGYHVILVPQFLNIQIKRQGTLTSIHAHLFKPIWAMLVMELVSLV